MASRSTRCTGTILLRGRRDAEPSTLTACQNELGRLAVTETWFWTMKLSAKCKRATRTSRSPSEQQVQTRDPVGVRPLGGERGEKSGSGIAFPSLWTA